MGWKTTFFPSGFRKLFGGYVLNFGGHTQESIWSIMMCLWDQQWIPRLLNFEGRTAQWHICFQGSCWTTPPAHMKHVGFNPDFSRNRMKKPLPQQSCKKAIETKQPIYSIIYRYLASCVCSCSMLFSFANISVVSSQGNPNYPHENLPCQK